jgi:hypothetical protein
MTHQLELTEVLVSDCSHLCAILFYNSAFLVSPTRFMEPTEVRIINIRFVDCETVSTNALVVNESVQ